MNMRKAGRLLRALHEDRRGRAMIEIILILGAIAIPLLIVLIFFGTTLKKWLKTMWDKVVGNPGGEPIDSDPGF